VSKENLSVDPGGITPPCAEARRQLDRRVERRRISGAGDASPARATPVGAENRPCSSDPCRGPPRFFSSLEKRAASRLWWDVVVRPILVRGAGPAVSSGITERRRAETALPESEKPLTQKCKRSVVSGVAISSRGSAKDLRTEERIRLLKGSESHFTGDWLDNCIAVSRQRILRERRTAFGWRPLHQAGSHHLT
jgi:hypothetical protein